MHVVYVSCFRNAELHWCGYFWLITERLSVRQLILHCISENLLYVCMYVMLRNVTLQNLCGYFIKAQNLFFSSFALEARYCPVLV